MPPVQNACYPSEPLNYSPDPTIDAEAQMCIAQDNSPVAQTRSPEEIRRAAAQQLALRSQQTSSIASQAYASAFAPSTHRSSSVLSLLAGPASLLAGCSHTPVEDSPPDMVDDPPDENPDPTETTDDGIGTTEPNFQASVCVSPVDMDTDGTSLFTTCGDVTGVDSGSGAGVVEVMNPSTGETTQIQLPTTMNDDSNRPIALTTAHVGTNGLVYVGFRAVGDVTSGSAETADRLGNDSGIFIVDPANPDNPTVVTFDSLNAAAGLPMSDYQLPDGIAPNFVSSFTPNTPVSIQQAGNELYVLTANQVLNRNASGSPLDVTWATVLAYTINEDGSLTPRDVTSQGNLLTKSPTEHGNAFAIQAFNPSALATMSDGRLVALTRGSVQEGAATVDNPSALHILTAGLSDAITTNISLTDSSGLNFISANSPSQLSILDIGGTPYTQVGSSDGEGRVAHVNLSTGEVEYRAPFNIEGEDVANVLAHPMIAASLVLSEAGNLRTWFYGNSNPNEVGPLHGIAGSVAAADDPTDIGFRHRIPAVVLGGSVYTASSGEYGRAELVTPSN